MRRQFRTILLADDDPDDRQLFREAAKEVDCELIIMEATDGENAYQALQGIPTLPDVVILDINMPTINGLECLQLIRQDKKLRRIPVIMMSTSQEKHSVDASFNLGADFYTPKPSNFNDLKKIIYSICKFEWKFKRESSRESHINTFL